MVERNGRLNANIVENVGSVTLTREIVASIKESESLYTDEWLGYKRVSRIYDHSIVKNNQGQYVNGRIHINTIEGF
jgi:ornithine carbamoyltransferase